LYLFFHPLGKLVRSVAARGQPGQSGGGVPRQMFVAGFAADAEL